MPSKLPKLPKFSQNCFVSRSLSSFPGQFIFRVCQLVSSCTKAETVAYLCHSRRVYTEKNQVCNLSTQKYFPPSQHIAEGFPAGNSEEYLRISFVLQGFALSSHLGCGRVPAGSALGLSNALTRTSSLYECLLLQHK